MSEPEKDEPSPEALELARRLGREGPPSEDAWDVWAARLIEAFGERRYQAGREDEARDRT